MIWEVWTAFIAELSPSRSFRESTIFDDQFVVHTSRLALRKAQIADVPALSAIWGDVNVRRYLGGSISADEANSRAQSRVEAGELCTVRLLDDARVIGCIDVRDRSNRELEISYLFSVDVWGHGYATESVAAVLNELRGKFEGHEMIAKTQMANSPSRRLLERIEFQMRQEVVEFGEVQAIYSRYL